VMNFWSYHERSGWRRDTLSISHRRGRDLR